MQAIIISKTIDLDAVPAALWPHLSTDAGVAGWLDATVHIESWPGGQYEEHGHHNGKDYVLRGRVLKTTPLYDLIVSYRIDTNDTVRWPVFTTVRFALHPAPGYTALTVTHRGFENLPERYRDFTRNDFDFGWGPPCNACNRPLRVSVTPHCWFCDTGIGVGSIKAAPYNVAPPLHIPQW
jgi:uncharacterized protein YndB with AHSA1/START domain